MIKQAVILAAGKGKRMKKNTDDHRLLNTPKPLLDVGGKVIIENTVKSLVDNGMEVAVVINPDDEDMFKEKLKDYDIRYCYQNEHLGTGHALFCAKDFVKDDLFLVMMGDDKIKHDIKEILGSDEPLVFGFEVDDVSSFGCIMTNEKGDFEDILEKKMSGKGLANTGSYVMHRKFFDIYNEISADEKSGEYFLTDVPKLLKKHGIKFKVKKMDFWIGINTPEQLKTADDIWSKRNN